MYIHAGDTGSGTGCKVTIMQCYRRCTMVSIQIRINILAIVYAMRILSGYLLAFNFYGIYCI